MPVISFSEVSGNDGTLPPAHTVSVVPKLNVGVMFGLTVTVKLVLVTHWPGAAVNV